MTILGFMAGMLLRAVTDAVERAAIGGDGWSLSGNGALVVPVCGAPVILILGWALLARWLQADRTSCLSGLGVGIFAVLLALVLRYIVSEVLVPLTLLAASVIALLLAHGAVERRSAGWLMAGAIVLPVAMYAGILLGGS